MYEVMTGVATWSTPLAVCTIHMVPECFQLYTPLLGLVASLVSILATSLVLVASLFCGFHFF